MKDVLTYIGTNPLGAAVLCAAGAFVLATLSALVAALRGGAGRIFGEYQALGRSISDSQKARRAEESSYSELRARVESLNQQAAEEHAPTEQP